MSFDNYVKLCHFTPKNDEKKETLSIHLSLLKFVFLSLHKVLSFMKGCLKYTFMSIRYNRRFRKKCENCN